MRPCVACDAVEVGPQLREDRTVGDGERGAEDARAATSAVGDFVGGLGDFVGGLGGFGSVRSERAADGGGDLVEGLVSQ